ncbi:hypothetical protein [uncultured Draconibacterium sp.]|uniref:hypothetical protein n=1 Tax=uncultured Draconibacterium sp. TaxID=1573823 RepID=UPI003217E8DA
MKKISFFTTFIGFAFILLAMQPKDVSVSPTLDKCSSTETSYTFLNVHAYGDQLLNNTEYFGLTDMLSWGYTSNIAIKASKDCTYSWNKTYNETSSDITGNTVNNVPIPNTPEYSVTLKVESSCVYDSYLNQNVKFVWTKTISSITYNSSTDLGFPTKALCPITSATLSDRTQIISIYEQSDRIASSELMMAL